MTERRDALAQQFQRFGERECLPASPLYARLAAGIAGDVALLDLAAQAQARPVPNLLFAAVQYLLLSGVPHPLSAYYPLDKNALFKLPQDDPFPLFRAFCLHHADAIAALLASRRVQTNEVQRCACLLPAFTLVAQRGGARPLALIEIGASAGLNLLWDRFAFHYGEQVCGEQTSIVQLHCELRGAARPPLPVTLPAIAFRIGLDLEPVDVRDADATRWLRALIWPEQRDRARLLEQALALAHIDPPPLLAGDAVTLLPEVVAQVPPQTTLCLYHTFVLNQFPQAAREWLQQFLDNLGATRDLAVVGIEWQEPAPLLVLTTYTDGVCARQTLASCDPHGAWLAWGAPQEGAAA